MLLHGDLTNPRRRQAEWAQGVHDLLVQRAAEHDLGFVGTNRNDGMAGAAGNARAGDYASAQKGISSL